MDIEEAYVAAVERVVTRWKVEEICKKITFIEEEKYINDRLINS